MKQINLRINKPCHENWDAMSATDKGKYCESCKKMVIDFTEMSDQEILQYFKSSSTSVCGRMNNEQLNRDISVPAKSIPWINYFFKFTFPAFIFFIKSCTPKSNLKTIKSNKIEVQKANSNTSEMIVGELSFRPITIIGDTTIVNTNTKKVVRNNNRIKGILLPEKDSLILNPITDIHSYQSATDNFTCLRGVAGGISFSVIIKPYKPIAILNKAIDTIFNRMVLFPNPIQKNSQLNIKFNKVTDGDYLISVISMSGVIVLNNEISLIEKIPVVSINLPNVTSGIYIVRVVNKLTGRQLTQKLIIK